MATELLHTDLEPFLASWLRSALADRTEAYAADVDVDRVEPDPGEPNELPRRLVIIRDDSGPIGLFTAERSIGISVLAGTREDPRDARNLALLIAALLPRLATVTAGNPVADVRDINGPYAVAEALPRARQYLTVTLIVVGQPL